MKKLILLSALLIFACSSDEGNDDYDNNSNQTFLERYDGVVWENPFFISNPQNEDDAAAYQYLIFTNSNLFFTFYRPNNPLWFNENECQSISEGLNDNGETFNITINNYNALQFTSDNAEENSLSIVDVSVLNNTIYLDISYSNSTNTYQEFANRTTLSNPCD